MSIVINALFIVMATRGKLSPSGLPYLMTKQRKYIVTQQLAYIFVSIFAISVFSHIVIQYVH